MFYISLFTLLTCNLLRLFSFHSFNTYSFILWKCFNNCFGVLSVKSNIWFCSDAVSTGNFFFPLNQFNSVQSLSRVWLFVIPWTAAGQASLSITNFQSLLKSCPSSQWCHPTILFSVVPFSSCLQSFPASGSFPISQFFASGGQNVRVSDSAFQSFQWIFRNDFL